MRPIFTPEELEEMRRADEEIDREFRLTNEDLARTRALDKIAIDDRKTPEQRKLAERQRAYYQANREKLAERQRAYREANREKLAERQRAYREANREKVAERQRTYREANREKVAERQRAYYQANREKLAERQRGRTLRTYRTSFGQTQKQLAGVLGVINTTISHWERGSVPINLALVRKKLPALADKLEETTT